MLFYNLNIYIIHSYFCSFPSSFIKGNVQNNTLFNLSKCRVSKSVRSPNSPSKSAYSCSIIRMNFYLIARRKKDVKSNNQLRVAFEEVGDVADYPRCINTFRKKKNYMRMNWNILMAFF